MNQINRERFLLEAGYFLALAEVERNVRPAALRGLAAVASTHRAQAGARTARLKLGEPTRQAARELMRAKPWLSKTACAREIANGKDEAGVRKVIAPLWAGKLYIGGDLAEGPGELTNDPSGEH